MRDLDVMLLWWRRSVVGSAVCTCLQGHLADFNCDCANAFVNN